ncbi:MAG: DUF6783 domain-containing protein [Ruminococcus sp.]
MRTKFPTNCDAHLAESLFFKHALKKRATEQKGYWSRSEQ